MTNNIRIRFLNATDRCCAWLNGRKVTVKDNRGSRSMRIPTGISVRHSQGPRPGCDCTVVKFASGASGFAWSSGHFGLEVDNPDKLTDSEVRWLSRIEAFLFPEIEEMDRAFEEMISEVNNG